MIIKWDVNISLEKKANMKLIVNNHNALEKNIQIYFSTFILKIIYFEDSLSGKIKVI
jgi:hypothetical protein